MSDENPIVPIGNIATHSNSNGGDIWTYEGSLGKVKNLKAWYMVHPKQSYENGPTRSKIKNNEAVKWEFLKAGNSTDKKKSHILDASDINLSFEHPLEDNRIVDNYHFAHIK